MRGPFRWKPPLMRARVLGRATPVPNENDGDRFTAILGSAAGSRDQAKASMGDLAEEGIVGPVVDIAVSIHELQLLPYLGLDQSKGATNATHCPGRDLASQAVVQRQRILGCPTNQHPVGAALGDLDSNPIFREDSRQFSCSRRQGIRRW